MMARLLAFHQKLETYNVRDHQLVDLTLGIDSFATLRVLIVRIVELLTMLVLALPGSVLLLPPMFLIRRYALEKAKKAKAASTVKLTGQDVISTVGIFGEEPAWSIIQRSNLLPIHSHRTKSSLAPSSFPLISLSSPS